MHYYRSFLPHFNLDAIAVIHRYGNRILVRDELREKRFIPARPQAHGFDAIVAIAGAI
jgi:hypothetical protein